ncbi:MAG: Fpg/Nei family DNA glycosylase, partial [Candidatus Limnocylindria bacterium]
MPEWPDLQVLRARLATALAGRRIVSVTVGDPVVVRATRPPEELLVGRTLRAVRQRGKYLLFECDAETALVVNPMLSGLFALAATGAPATRDTRLTLSLDDARDLRYRDDTRMGKVYLLRGERPEDAVPGFAALGPEPADLEGFADRARRRGGDVRNMLMDQRFVAGIGNAYADEILWAARLHPKRPVRSLGGDELSRLEDALHVVLARAVDEVEAGTPPALGTKVRAHLRVRGRAGEPCPRCGAPIRRTRKGDDETHY